MVAPPQDPRRTTYTGGTPTAGYATPEYLARTPQQVMPEEDFRQSTWMQDWWETKGAANRARYLARNPDKVPNVGRARAAAGTTQWQRYQIQKAAELDAEFDRRNQLVGINHPVVKDLVAQAKAAGVQLQPGDLANLARVGELERAKNVIIDRIKAGDNRGVGNVMLTMRQRDPKMAALLSPMVEDALTELAKNTAEDPNLIENAISWLGESDYSPVKRGLQGLMWVNEQVRHVGAAATYDPRGGGFTLANMMTMNPGTIAGRAMQNWDATGRGAMSEQRLAEIRREYPAQVVDAALEIQRRLADGDDAVFAEMLSDDTTDPVVVSFIRDVLYNGPQTLPFDSGDLQERIEGARLDNIGDITSTALAQVVEDRTGSDYMYDSSWRGAMSQVGNLVWELGADPLNYVGTPIRAVTATRYAITKLAPTGLTGEAARIPIEKALASRTVAGIETNRARRYFQGILDQLDHIDTFTPGSIEASSAWQRLVRQHREIPEDILLEMSKSKNIQKVNGKRTMDGALIGEGEGAARRADGFIDWIVRENETWQASVGKASKKAQQAGEAFLIEQAVKAKLIDELEPDDLVALAAGKRPQSGITMDEILQQARQKLPQETLDRADEIVDGAIRREGAANPYLAQRFKQRNKRDQVIPYTGVLGDLRRRTVNGIIAERIGATRTQAIIDEFIGEDLAPESVANALDVNFKQDIAGADRSVRGRAGRAQALSDRVSGLLSSMPNGRFINIKTGENAEEVYRFARMFYTRKTAEFLADKFRRGDEGTRRLLLAGLIRSAAASKGVNLSAEDVWARIGDLATGSRRDEMFAIPVPGTPSGDMMKATLDQVSTSAKAAKKEAKRVKRTTVEIEKLQVQIDGATAAGDEAAVKSLTRQLRRQSARLAKQERRAARATADVDRYKKRLLTALGRNDEARPSAFQQRIPAPMAEQVEERLAAAADPGVVAPPKAALTDEERAWFADIEEQVRVEREAAAADEVLIPTPAEMDAGLPGEPVAPIATPEPVVTVKLPEDLRGAKPRYRDKNVTFADDIDRALFIVRNGVKKSRRDADYMEFLRRQFPDLDDAGIRYRGEKVADVIKGLYGESADEVMVPRGTAARAWQELQARQQASAPRRTDPTADSINDVTLRWEDKSFNEDWQDGVRAASARAIAAYGSRITDEQFARLIEEELTALGNIEMFRPFLADATTTPRQQVLADSGDLVDEAPAPVAREAAPTPQADQMAFDAQGMTPPPQVMRGGAMQEMPFDEAPAGQPIPPTGEPPAPWAVWDEQDGAWVGYESAEARFYFPAKTADWRILQTTVPAELDALPEAERLARIEATLERLPAQRASLSRVDADGNLTWANVHAQDFVWAYNDIYGRDMVPVSEVRQAVARATRTNGKESRPLDTESDRPEMPMEPVNQLAFPDREAGYGYRTTIAAGKGKPRDVVVTTGETRHGNPQWHFELGADPDKQYDLTLDLRFNEWGEMDGQVWTPDGNKEYMPSKAKSLLLAKAIVQEAKKYAIPVRGQLRDWLEMIGAKPVAENAPAPWYPRAVIRSMSHEELDMAAEWILRHEPSLGLRDDLWGAPVQRSNIRGRGTGGQYPHMNAENPLVRRWLAAYLGLIDGVPKPDLDELRATAFARTTRNIPGEWRRVGDREYVTDDGWRIHWDAKGPTEDMPWRSSDSGDYVLTDPDGTVVKRRVPSVGDNEPDRELDWGDLRWAMSEANERRGYDEVIDEDRWDQIDELDEPVIEPDGTIASPALDEPAIEPAAEALQGLPTFDEYLEAHPRFDEFSRMLESLNGRFDEQIARELGDLEDDISAEWATMIFKDGDVRASYLDSLGLPDGDEIPEQWREHFGDMFDQQAIDKQAGENMGISEVGGAQSHEVNESLGLGDNFWIHGGVTRGQLYDLIDEYGEEAIWAWWNTGNMEAYAAEDFFQLYGPSPKLRPDPGKGLPAARKAAQIPGEYTGAAFTAPTGGRRGSLLVKRLEAAKKDLVAAQKSGDEVAIARAEYEVGELTRRVNKRKPSKPVSLLKVPWKGSQAEREDYILRKYQDMQEEAVEAAEQGADRVAIQRHVDAVLAERTAARQQVAAVDEIADDVLPIEQAPIEQVDVVEQVDEVVDEASPVPASEDVIQGTVLARVDEPIPAPEPAAAAAAPPAQPPGEPPRGLEGAGEPEPAPRLPKTGELAQWLAKYQGNGRNLPTQVIDGETFVTPSRDEFGREHAVHLYQTSDYVVIPHLAEIEAFGRIRNAAPWLGQAMQTSTDIWSLATLYGFRFAMRSSVEDLMTFALTGGLGHLADLQRGRRGSTAIREANPDIVVEPEKIAGKATGEEKIVTPATDQWWALGRKRPRTSRLGMVARTSRHLSDMLMRGNLESTQAFWLGNLSQDDVVHAAAEMQSGRYGAMQGLIATAVGRMHFTGMAPGDVRALQLLGGTHAGRMILEQMAEAGAQINSGTYKALDDAVQAVADNPDLAAVGFKRPVQFGAFKRLALSANKQSDPFADWYWHRSLQAIVRDDGPIGQIFVKLMHDPDRAKKAIADAIRKDTRMGYRERFSLITSDTAIDDFAHRYYEASLPYFQKADGTINEALRDRFITQWVDPKTGQTKMRVNWYQTDKQGRQFLRVHPKALARMPREDKPLYVLGREEKVVTPTNEKALLDRPWEWMGNQYARVAREPIFIGNYMANMRALEPMKQQLAQAMANGRAGKVGAKVTDTDLRAAEAIVATQSQDAAYAFSLNYMDNPGNRSVLAWKVRNVARYYRATEDFARRATRLAKNYPDAYYKLAITYQVLEDTGFTYRDDNGDMYFAYPANGMLQDAFTAIGGLFGGVGSPVAADPFMVGGFVKNIAPSTDPEQWAPTLTGVVTLPLVGLFNMFPSLQGLRAATLGGYSSAGQTGSLVGEMVDAIMPAGVKRIWSQLEPSERDAALGSAMAGAVASMIADGKMDHVYNTDTPLTLEQLKKDDVYAEAQRRALGITLTKAFLGYTAPASPQVFQNNVTQFARESGIEGIDSLWQDLIDQNNGDIAAAYLDWQRLDPEGRLLPFTVSKTKNNPDRLIGLTGAKPYKEVIDWMRADGTKDIARRFPDAYMFLAPQEGTFDWAAWSIIKADGFRTDKTEDEMLIDLFAANGEQMDRQIVTAYEAQMAGLDPNIESQRLQLRELEAQRAADREQVKNMNPYWATKSQTRLEPYDVESIRQQFIQTQDMLTYLREKGELTGTAAAIDQAMQAWVDVNIAKKSVNAYTDAGKAQRDQWDAELAQVLAEISASDPGARNFIETILSSSSLFGRLT